MPKQRDKSVLPPDFGDHPGYIGAFTRASAEGAPPSGSRLAKIAMERGDTHEIGALATLLGSIKSPPGELAAISPHFYFVEWDDQPRIAVGVLSWKMGLAQ